MRSAPIIDRLMSRVVEDENGCWIFTGPIRPDGYGVIGVGPRGAGVLRTHRVTYEFFVAEIPAGLHMDHLCRVRACCNPWHLDPVPTGINTGRGVRKTQQTHCKQGHEFTPENTKQTTRQRTCLTCSRKANRDYQSRRRAAA